MSRIMSMQGYARGLLQETAAVVTSPAAAPTTRHGGTAVSQPAGNSPTVPAPPSTPSPYSAFDVNSHFSPIMIIILVILTSAFLFMGFFAIYVRRCAGDDSFSRRAISSRRDLQLPTFQRGCGVDPLLIESYPIVSYATAKKKGCSECVVCLTDFEGGEELKQLPKCKHVFHPGCISSWLESHTTCPLCRRSLVNSDRWSVSFRWGGSSRGSLSRRLNDGGGSRSRSRRDGETANPRTFGWAGSSRGWHLWVPGRNENGSSRGSGQEEATPDVLDPNPSCESAPCGLPASPLSSELVTRGLPPSPLSGLSTAASIECGLRASPLSSNQVPRGCQTGIESLQSSPMSSEVATNASLLSAEVAAQRGGMTPRQVVVGRRRLSRSNSTGHSLRKGAVSRAAMQVPAGAVDEWGQTAGCMPLSACSLHRSRSMRLDGHEEAAAAAMVEPGSAMSDQSL